MREEDDRNLTVTGMRASEILAESSDEDNDDDQNRSKPSRDSNEMRVSALLRETDFDKKLTTTGYRATQILNEQDESTVKDTSKLGDMTNTSEAIETSLQIRSLSGSGPKFGDPNRLTDVQELDEEEKIFMDKYFAADTLLEKPQEPVRKDSLTMEMINTRRRTIVSVSEAK